METTKVYTYIRNGKTVTNKRKWTLSGTPRGRKCTITPQLFELMLEEIANGQTVKKTCLLNGVSKDAYYRFKKKRIAN
ncbi:MAG: hypothetical protein KAT68_11805 [Bacteroidales bacterium]|nr:hypothetical protein [Bacteroidales bacterium]